MRYRAQEGEAVRAYAPSRYRGVMIPAVRTFGRVLMQHWPAMAAWFIGGEAVHQLLVQLAGFIGGYTSLGGLLVLPLAVAAKLVAYVAMYLTVRPSLPHVSAPPSGYRAFANAILVSILPFFAFYSAWGMLTADLTEFASIASDIAFRETGYDVDLIGDRGGIISVGVLPVAVLVIALIARLLLSRFRDRLPGWTLGLAAYAEVLWTFMLFTLVGQWWADAKEWLAGRTGMTWLQAIGDWFAMNISPVAAIWEGLLWTIGLLAAVLIVPAAWLAVAGVIYGTTFDAAPASVQRRLDALRGSAATLSRSLLQRFEDLWAAFAVIWRGGPLVFGTAVCAYALWGLAERWGTRGVLVLIGGRESDFWVALLPLILVAAATVFETLRVALVATAYDAVVARPAAGLEASGGELEADGPVVAGHIELERAGGIGGQGENGENIVRS